MLYKNVISPWLQAWGYFIGDFLSVLYLQNCSTQQIKANRKQTRVKVCNSAFGEYISLKRNWFYYKPLIRKESRVSRPAKLSLKTKKERFFYFYFLECILKNTLAAKISAFHQESLSEIRIFDLYPKATRRTSPSFEKHAPPPPPPGHSTVKNILFRIRQGRFSSTDLLDIGNESPCLSR